MMKGKDSLKNAGLLFVLLHFIGSVKVTIAYLCIMYHVSTKEFLLVHIIDIKHTTISKVIKLQFEFFNVHV